MEGIVEREDKFVKGAIESRTKKESMEEPSNKKCIKTLMRVLRKERRTVVDNAAPRQNVPYLVFECPRRELSRHQDGLSHFRSTEGTRIRLVTLFLAINRKMRL